MGYKIGEKLSKICKTIIFYAFSQILFFIFNLSKIAQANFKDTSSKIRSKKRMTENKKNIAQIEAATKNIEKIQTVQAVNSKCKLIQEVKEKKQSLENAEKNKLVEEEVLNEETKRASI